jgi:hypothetical protein
MSQEYNQSGQIQQIASLKPKHFADLIRAAQLIFDPAAGLTGRHVQVNWQDFGIPHDVEQNLKDLGLQYQYASPHIPGDIIWSQLSPETRIWFLNNKDDLWRFEEAFPALDED